MNCWLAQFSSKPCDGPEDFAHLIDKQTLKKGVADLSFVWDERFYRPACRFHHANFDNRRLTVPRSAIPQSTEELARELGLTWWLDRRYGSPDERSEAWGSLRLKVQK